MRARKIFRIVSLIGVTCLAVLTLELGNVWGHCDSESGPVAVDARKALANDSFKTVAIWVGPGQHAKLLSAFDQALPVYRMGGNAKDLAERYFTEAAVRLHREAEGMTYEGVKPPQPLPPDIAAAEKALETGDLNPVTNMLTAAMRQKAHHLFSQAREAAKSRDKSLAAGRQWADAYVRYVIYVHGLYNTIQTGPAHGVGE